MQRRFNIIGRAKAFLFAAEEDSGIAPIEAQACGTPVIAFGRGGALETILDGETGLFFPEQTAAAVVAAVERFEAVNAAFDAERIRVHAEGFSEEAFRSAMGRVVDCEWDAFVARGRMVDPTPAVDAFDSLIEAPPRRRPR